MKPVVTRLYAFMVILTLAGLAAWSVADWNQSRQHALERGQSTLREAAGHLSDLTTRHIPLGSEVLTKIFAPATGNDYRWKMVLLHSPEQGTEYYRGPKPAVAVDQAVPRWEPKEFSEVKIALPVFRTGLEPSTLEGIYEFYGRAEIFSLLKACGIVLVFLLVLTTLMVILSYRTAAKPESAPPKSPEPADEETESLELNEESLKSDEAPLGDFPEETVGTIPVETEGEEEYWFEDELTLEDLPPLEPQPQTEASVPASSEEAVAEAEPEPAPPSLFSPSGLGWGSFLTTRLDFELERAASQNQDLSLVLLAAKSGSLTGRAWGEAVKEAFPSADLDFEYEGGVAIVLPSTSLEQALKATKDFIDNCDRQFDDVPVHAGVSARSGRLLSASVLLAEAKSAQRRSLAGTVRVLGLKTDADRWRDHVSSASA